MSLTLSCPDPCLDCVLASADHISPTDGLIYMISSRKIGCVCVGNALCILNYCVRTIIEGLMLCFSDSMNWRCIFVHEGTSCLILRRIWVFLFPTLTCVWTAFWPQQTISPQPMVRLAWFQAVNWLCVCWQCFVQFESLWSDHYWWQYGTTTIGVVC